MKAAFASLGLMVVLGGCEVVGPAYQPPSATLQAAYVGGASPSLVNAAATPWWERLHDPLLNRLVERGAARNLDIRAAVARIEAANAALGQTGVNAQTGGSLDASVQHRSVDGNDDTVSNLSADARFVFDLFGGVFRRQQQAIANAEAAQFDAGTVRLAYLSDIANSYIQARYFQEAAAITRQTISSRRRTLSVVNQRLNEGEATELERQQARSLLLASEAALPTLLTNFEVQVYRIATLLAEPAGPLLAQMRRGARQPMPRGGAVGVPADLLRNRPDIRFAERNLAAATAGIGIAEAQLYPSLQLSGTVSAGTTDGWTFGPFLSIPLLNRGVLKSRQKVAEAQARGAEVEWRRAVVAAVEDVQTEMALYRGLRGQLAALNQAYRASGRVLELSRELYTLGDSTLTEVLDAERAHAANRLAIADASRNLAVSWVRLQVATGKGWRATEFIPPQERLVPVAPKPDPMGLEGTVLVSQKAAN